MILDYSIEVLNVGAADSIILDITYSDIGKKLILIDAGNYQNGKFIVEHLAAYYPNRIIDVALVTHPDKDHFGGFIYLLESIKAKLSNSLLIGEFWINDPSNNHIKTDDVKWYKVQENLNYELHHIYDYDEGRNLLDMIDYLKITRKEQFAEIVINPQTNIKEAQAVWEGLYVVSPSKSYFEHNIISMRGHNVFPYTDIYDKDEDDGCTDCLSKRLDDSIDDNSANNQSSLQILLKVDDIKKFLFTGDAGKEAFSEMSDLHKELCKNVSHLKVPHHGSKHNLDSEMIFHYSPSISIISAAGFGKQLSYCVRNALKKVGSKVFSTHNNVRSILYNLHRDGWGPANPI